MARHIELYKNKNNPEIFLSTGKTVRTARIKREKTSWSEFAEKLNQPIVTEETFSEYMEMGRERQDEIKDVGYYVGGTYAGRTRKKSELESRSLICLDIDHAPEDFMLDIDLAHGDWAFVIHSTHKHCDGSPRLRQVFQSSRPITRDEYEPVARMLAHLHSMDWYDDTTYQPSRVMHWPSRSTDGDWFYHKSDSEVFVDPDEILGMYDDWRDVTQWPVSSRAKKKTRREAEKAEDPREKRGIIGAFCRAYPMSAGIDLFLSDQYEPGSSDNRYTYVGGSTANGAIVYEDLFLFSNHDTDPVSQTLVNLFDLVRIHKFGHLDKNRDENTPVTKLPSYKEMKVWALEQEGVTAELEFGRNGDYSDDFIEIKPADLQDAESFSWAEEFEMSLEEANQISDPKWIVKNLIIEGHLIVVVAEPNGGKTTIFFWLSGEMVGKGYSVFYVNADISGADAKAMIEQARKENIRLLLPDFKAGKSATEILEYLAAMNESGADFSKTIFIFDTLKKLITVIDKRQAKKLFKLLRSLTAKGMTIILLAHTNKYKGEDGMPIYEGTGDLRADVDELIYLIPDKHPDGSMTVSTLPDKVRGSFQPLTFQISADRKVTLAEEFVDTASIRKAQTEIAKDQAYIDAINSAISEGSTVQSDITVWCRRRQGIGPKTTIRVLKKFSDPDVQPVLWRAVRGEKNSLRYEMAAPNFADDFAEVDSD